MNLTEIEELLHEHVDHEWGEWHYRLNNAPEFVEGLGAVEVVDTEGNTEGGGEYSHIIFKVTFPIGNVRYFKMEGNYQSFNGCEWDGPFTEVAPAQKTITVYDNVLPV